jgi:uncharacterized repeat protein (TIGR03803 family)
MKQIFEMFLMLCATAVPNLPAQTFTTLYSFCAQSGCPDGEYPDGALLQAADGNLYGTTYNGGNVLGGTIYKITTSGALTTLHDFCTPSGVCPQNIGPETPLIQSSNGRFFGTTFGEAERAGFPGAIFEIAGGRVKTLHHFCSQRGCRDGENPAGVIQGERGELYGTTEFGGKCGYSAGCGTVFKITPEGMLTTLYDFCENGGTECADGQYPVAGLVQGANGDFYGTTYFGGNLSNGTVFKMTPNGTLTTLHTFCTQVGCPDGDIVVVGLTLANGDLYGVTQGGGSECFDLNGCGTIFKVTPVGVFTTLYTFCQAEGTCTDGATPVPQLVEGSDGNLYGATAQGGPLGVGTIFRVTPSGALTTLYGAGATTLMQDTNGDFYGTTSMGGAYCPPSGCGTIFRLSVGLGPFVKTRPASGTVGSAIKILGTNLTGATAVTFNGTPVASFAVNSSGSAISTTVPDGATTGKVQVVTPNGTLSSDLVFRVRR